MAFLNKTAVQVPALLGDQVDLYWKPWSLSANLIEGRLDVQLGLWEKKEAAQLVDGKLLKAPLDTRAVTAFVADYPQLAKIIGAVSQGADENAKKLLYEMLGQHPDLTAYGLVSDEA